LTAPRAQPPPSQIPTERLTTTAERWQNGSLQASPTPPPSLNPMINSQPQMQPHPQQQYTTNTTGTANGMNGSAYGNQGGGNYLVPQGQNGHLTRPQSYSVGAAGSGYPSGSNTMHHTRPASFAGQPPPPPPGSYGNFPQMPPPPPQNQQPLAPYGQPPPTQMNPYFPSGPPPPPAQQQLQQQQNHLSASPAPTPAQNGTYQVGRPPRVASMQPNDFNTMQNGMSGMSLSGSSNSLGGSQNGHGTTTGRVNYYASPEEGPPHKLSVTHPDVSLFPRTNHSRHEKLRKGEKGRY